jgi:MFS family permease
MDPRGSRMSPERAARGAVTAVFFLNGFLFVSLVARMPAIRDHAGVTNGELGIALASVAIGAVVAMPIAGALAARHGSRQVTRGALALSTGAVLLPVLATSLPALAAAFLVMGLAMGSLDVTMNAHGVAVERRYGRPILSGFHAAFSFGGLAGAATAATAAAAQLDLQVHAALVAAASLMVGLGWSRSFLPAAEDAAGAKHPVLARPPRRLWALGAVAFSCLLVEGAAADWSAVYVHDELNASAATAASAYAAFSLTMAVGRLFGDRLVERVGPVALLRGGGVLAAGGIGAGLAAGAVPGALLGFAALGAGLAAVIPVVFRAAGSTPGIPPGMALAAVSSTGYLGFVAGPPIIGSAAEAVGLPAALLLLVVLGLVIAALARSAQPVATLAR